jgi:mannose-1-phosphate guanylyltransferase
MKALLLSAGLGTRLLPYTHNWPKCLMPIKGRPLLEYWLSILKQQNIDEVLINRHHHSETVKEFLQQPQFNGWVKSVYEEQLLGTAGTVRKNTDFFRDNTVLIAHADNWCCCDFEDFISYHNHKRPAGTLITMMTFDCENPSSCGIVELDDQGVVVGFHEKIESPPGWLANAAVYIIEPEVLQWIEQNQKVNDFTTEVLPYFVGKITTWKNNNIHKDIGTIEILQNAQLDNCEPPFWDISNRWQEQFNKHSIHKEIKEKI